MFSAFPATALALKGERALTIGEFKVLSVEMKLRIECRYTYSSSLELTNSNPKLYRKRGMKELHGAVKETKVFTMAKLTF